MSSGLWNDEVLHKLIIFLWVAWEGKHQLNLR